MLRFFAWFSAVLALAAVVGPGERLRPAGGPRLEPPTVELRTYVTLAGAEVEAGWSLWFDGTSARGATQRGPGRVTYWVPTEVGAGEHQVVAVSPEGRSVELGRVDVVGPDGLIVRPSSAQ